MKRILSLFLAAVLLALSGCDKNVQVRFDSVYFFQSEEDLQKKKVDPEEMSRYTRNLQSQVAKVMKSAQAVPGNGYIVVAVRSDEEVAAWLDMEPALHEYYDYEIVEAIKKLRPFKVETGIVVFAIKMAVDTPKHTEKPLPEPTALKEAQQKVGDPKDIEQVVLAAWPEE
ncbi:hypothetical protein [Undibacterium fentianense]|uniref:DUF4136 domain-containing protein n=1 Tax=Undibacterium fentianense TaxID=2828728 RepID=A0A941E843_9BURK|nr:hypothetical protein [Undibacterium fentianense]MBR7800423.1 hypothetical protein [Undibacterium fentianense]